MHKLSRFVTVPAQVILLVLVTALSSQAATFTVTNTNDSDAGSFRQAIDNANANPGADTIVFDETIFATHQTIESTIGYTIEASGKLTIVGPAVGVTLSLANSQVFPRRVFGLFDASADLEIRNLTLTGGNTYQGGGIYSEGTLTVLNSTITGNHATERGGGITSLATLTVSDSTIIGNTAVSVGGGIVGGSTSTVVNTTVSGNSANDVGGVYNLAGTLTLSNVTVSGNSANAYGGGVYNFLGTLTMTGSRVVGNTASAGGGIANYNGTFAIMESVVSGNTVGFLGGGYFHVGGTLTINRSTFSNNSAGQYGGGLWTQSDAQPSSASATNSTFSGNSAGLEGAAVYNASGTLSVSSSTLTNNTSLYGAIRNVGGTASLANTIVAGNVDADGGQAPDLAGDFVSEGYNLIGANDFSTGFIDGVNDDKVGSVASPIDPMLGPLQDNGGPTFTHALVLGSPAIDAGSSGLTTDQRGFFRPYDHPMTPNGTGNLADIGSFEIVICPLPQGDWKNDPDAWPVNELTLGNAIYTKAELLEILNTPVGTGRNADASLILAYQLIAAKLNVASGKANAASVAATIAEADALLSGYPGKLPYRVRPSTSNGQLMTGYAAILDAYNKGTTTAGCSQ